METNMAVTLYGEPRSASDGAAASPPVDTVFQRVEFETRRLAERFSDFSDASALSRLSGKRGDTLLVDPEVETVLLSALQATESSHGLFDFTLHDLKFLWGLGEGHPGHMPDTAELDSLLAENPTYLRHRHTADTSALPPLLPIEVLPGHRAVMHRSQTRLDLGGIAKGYIVDRLHRLLDSLGYPVHLIQAGGEIRTGGHKQGRKDWLIGIRHPRLHDSLCGMLTSPEPLAVSTSGDYERFFMHEGRRYHHLFDPRTGRPATASIAVTVVADSSRQTDALTKPLFIMGPEQGMAYARAHGAKAVWFKESGPGKVCAIPMPEIKPMLSLKDMDLCPVNI